MIEKLGMGFIRENPCGFKKNGKAMAEFEYALTKDEYTNSLPRQTRQQR